MRLFHKIYLSLLGVAFLGTALTVLVNHDLLKPQLQAPYGERLEAEALLLDREIGVAGSREGAQAAIERAAGSLGLMAAQIDGSGRRLAGTADDLKVLHALATDPRWVHTRSGLARVVVLPSGRRLVVRARSERADVSYALAGVVLFLALAIGCYPVARRLTSRIEILARGVRELGEGRLDTRVTLAGSDEVALLAGSFNRAADRIEGLVAAQRRVLASASHELRSPLTRLRMGLELIRDSAGAAVERQVTEAANEVQELDRARGRRAAGEPARGTPADRTERVDLGTLLSAEAERVGASTEGPSVSVMAEPRMLRRLVRNLLENARRHGGGGAIAAGVEPLSGTDGGVRLWVADRGPGVAPGEQERIFEPFYRPVGSAQSEGGAGLGLSLVRQIAEHHGGSAQCRPRDGGGTVFEVILRGTA